VLVAVAVAAWVAVVVRMVRDVAPWYSGLLASGNSPRIGSTLTVEYDDGGTEDYRLNAVPMSTEAEVFLTRIDGTLDCD
jgi:hypothetical protein